MDKLTLETIQAVQVSVESLGRALKAQSDVNESVRDELTCSHAKIEFLSEKIMQSHIELRVTREIAASCLMMIADGEGAFKKVINHAVDKIKNEDDSIILKAVDVNAVEGEVESILAKMMEARDE